jgi:hypothetical protein
MSMSEISPQLGPCDHEIENKREESSGCQFTRLADCLADEFQIVRKLVGEESFEALATQFVGAFDMGPASSELASEFPQFIRGLGRLASIEYLADIAELEKARAKAAQSPIMPSISPSRLSSALERPADTMCVDFQPSLSLIMSRFPIVTIWRANHSGNACALDQWGRETALVARSSREVATWRLPSGGFAFLSALLDGATWSAAIEAAATSDISFDVRVNRTLVIEADIVIGLRDVSLH